MPLTVVIATHLGVGRIGRTLDSLEKQTAPGDHFEVLVLANGPDDGTPELVRRRAADSPIHIRLLQTPIGGFAQARTLGIHAARGEYVTWVDDDDWVSPSYVSTMLAHASHQTVVIPIFADVQQDDPLSISFVNYINRYLLRYCGQTVPFTELPTAANFDAGKVIAREVAATASFDLELVSGLDVLYWASVITRHELSITVPRLDRHAVYYRTVRSGSISRVGDDRFGRDRLLCIAKLQDLRSGDKRRADFVQVLQGGQASNLGMWLKASPARRPQTLARIKRLGIPDFPYQVMNCQSSDNLVFACAFPPVKDTSGVVAAKRLLQWGEPFDLVTQSMKEVEATTSCLVDEHLGATLRIEGKPSGTTGITAFPDEALRRLELNRNGEPYARMYSRSPWPAALLAAAGYKACHPETVWTAEFSDPLLIDVAGRQRFAVKPANSLISTIDDVATRRGFRCSTDNVFQWLEAVTFALADRIIFTNELQRELMLRDAVSSDFASRALEASQVLHQPTLPSSYYSRVESHYRLEPGRAHLGYFGKFHRSRDVNDILNGFAELSHQERRTIMLHIFTNDPRLTNAIVVLRGLDDCVRVSECLPFLEFLNLTTRFDWLLVSDARVTSSHGLNPYLPAKYADYRGSGSKIWGMVEPGSTLDSLPLDAKTSLGDLEESVAFLRTIT